MHTARLLWSVTSHRVRFITLEQQITTEKITMYNRKNIVDLASKINTEAQTPEIMLMSLMLRVLLDIRDQNSEILKELSKD